MIDNIKRLRAFWCEWTHGGGHIERDEQGRIDWRCAKCRRWGGYPVPIQDEASVVRAEFQATTLEFGNELMFAVLGLETEPAGTTATFEVELRGHKRKVTVQ